tara:strand:+ start:1474 stop:2358 length:885 start_codon:yes stop_codon:yes gene_type:complete
MKATLDKPKTDSKNNNFLDISKLWENYHQARSKGNGIGYRNQLLDHFFPLVEYSAEQIYFKTPENIEFDDLISYGIFGLIDAIEAFEPKKNVKFETYSQKRIRGSIFDELREADWTPRLTRTRKRLFERADQSLKSQLNYPPNNQQLTNELSKKKYVDWSTLGEHRIKKAKKILGEVEFIPVIFYLPSTISPDNDRQVSKPKEVIETLKNRKAPNPKKIAQLNDLVEVLTRGLNKNEKQVLNLYYYDEMTMNEIGKVVGLSESRISQVHTELKKKSKEKLEAKGLNFAQCLNYD